MPKPVRDKQDTLNGVTKPRLTDPPRKQRRWDLPLDSKARERAAQITALKISGKTTLEIAEIMGLGKETIKNYLWMAGKNGWLRLEDPAERLEIDLLPQVIDNIAFHLERKDKTMTIETAKGVGLFKSHQSVKSEGEAPQTVLALKIEMPTLTPDAVKALIPAGAVVGTAKSK